MPEITLNGSADEEEEGYEELMVALRKLDQSIPCHQEDAVFIDARSSVRDTNDRWCPFIRIEGPMDMPTEDLTKIANHYVGTIDVSVRNGAGRMVYRAKGGRFDRDCLIGP